jgi:glutamate---cysteine ligase / carboxylate-amine ligase
MSDLVFGPSKALTLGVEVEVQLLNKNSLDLTPVSPIILSSIEKNQEKIKAEIFQSMLELNTGICQNAHEVRTDLGMTMDIVKDVCQRKDIRIASSGTHPFANVLDRIIYPADRYQDLIDRNQWIARRLVIFGVHIHIGMRNGEHAIQMNNALLHYLPLFLALSASSPFWSGENTQLASSRITFFEALPTGGHPCQVNSWQEYTDLYGKMIRSKAIRSAKDIWWDIRPSPHYGTIEIRICDGFATLAETVAVTALVHALCIYIDKQLGTGKKFAPPPDWIMRENKWRASRWGIDSELIVDNDGQTAHFHHLIFDLFKELEPILAEQNYLQEAEFIKQILEKGPSYKRQRTIASLNDNDLKVVTDFLAREFALGKPLW